MNPLFETAFAAIDSLLSVEKAVYLSTPITSGAFYLEALKKGNKAPIEDNTRREIIRINTDNSKSISKSLREKYRYVINPAEFELVATSRTWSQELFRAFWVEVIRKYCNKVVIANDWWLSYGCCVEVLSALESRIPVQGIDDLTLSFEKAREKAFQGLESYATFGVRWTEVEKLLRKT